MKTTLLTILAFAIISCNKTNTNAMAETQTYLLKAIPTATVEGKTITFTADKSTGPIVAYGYQLQEASPTQSPVTYSPSSSQKAAKDEAGNYKSIVFSKIVATVQKTGVYTFDLRVYDKEGNIDLNTFNVEVK